MNPLSSASHSSTILDQWRKRDRLQRQTSATEIDGHSLEIATIVSVARHGNLARLTNQVLKTLEQSRETIRKGLEQGKVIYGVNTGFGGSADTRIFHVNAIQKTIIHEFYAGILTTPKKQDGSVRDGEQRQTGYQDDALPLTSDFMCMPESWARAAMIIRVNSLASGYSGVRAVLVQRILDLLKHNIVPRIPLRGSISASGDLMPLSYLCGAISGDPNVQVWVGSRNNRYLTTADVALEKVSLPRLDLGPKEGLAVVNGTAVSAGVAALAIQETNCLAVLSQVLTAMSVEALLGTKESFDEFFARVRPHPGQIEASRNIFSFLKGSQLAKSDNSKVAPGQLVQDRYSVRTASQWIGPVLEDLQLAYQQISIEVNSVTDNPLVDTANGRILSGGNFQARAVTSAMEKTRQGIQILGQMHFTQSTELMNPKMSRGLPPNLAPDEPTESWLLKPLDILTAALQSELGFLANNAGSHIQSAEMGNQALNSLALVSARYTHTALDILSQLVAAHLFAVCQALDLRAMHIRFLEDLESRIRTVTLNLFGVPGILADGEGEAKNLWSKIWNELQKKFDDTVTLESSGRFVAIFKALQPLILEAIDTSADSVSSLRCWTEEASKLSLQCYNESRAAYLKNADASPYLGAASFRLYKFVRSDLGVPLLHLNTPSARGGVEDGTRVQVGTFVTAIYNAIRDGRLYGPVMESLAEVGWEGISVDSGRSKL